MSELRDSTTPTPVVAEAAESARSRRGGLALTGLLIAVTVLIAVGALIGLWYLPFIVGVVVGLVMRRRRAGVVLPVAAAVAMIGWAIPLLWLDGSGQPIGATAAVVAALAGLPSSAALVLALTMLVAALQGLAGSLLARAIRRAAR